jgi:acetylornithine/N-succinyldiaminopimelate aminotransferase
MDIKEFESKHFFQTYKRIPVEISRGEGCYLITKDGRKILDFFSGLSVNALGHGNRDVLRAIIHQTKDYLHLSNFYFQDAQIELARAVMEASGYDRIFLSNSGTEAIEGAIKLVRKRGKSVGKNTLVSLRGAFHGRTMGSLSLMDRPKYKDGYDPFLPDVVNIELNDIDGLEKAINENTAGFFFEPVQGEGGVRPVTEEFVTKLAELRERYGFLLVADEIQTGIGRTGKFLACEHFSIKPDITVLAKALGGGLPVGALLTTEELNKYFPAGSHGTTFGGNPVACAAGKVVVKKVSDAAFLSSVEQKAEHLRSALLALQEKYPAVIKDVRGVGLMIGIDLHVPGMPFVDKFLEKNVFINCTAETVLRLLPPLIIGEKEIETFIGVFEEVLS